MNSGTRKLRLYRRSRGAGQDASEQVGKESPCAKGVVDDVSGNSVNTCKTSRYLSSEVAFSQDFPQELEKQPG